MGITQCHAKNIEAGVALLPANTRECKNRLPCLLPHADDLSSANYIPALPPADIQQIFYSGQQHKAVALLRDRWSSNAGGALLQGEDDNEDDPSSLVGNPTLPKAKTDSALVTDLCDSD